MNAIKPPNGTPVVLIPLTILLFVSLALVAFLVLRITGLPLWAVQVIDTGGDLARWGTIGLALIAVIATGVMVGNRLSKTR